MENVLNSKKYVFLLAHPDDEVYCCVLMSRLIKVNKKVCVIYATSGDAGGNAADRENEIHNSMAAIGVKKEDVHFLRIPEMRMLEKINEIIEGAAKIAKEFGVDCVIGQDYEGGHEGHDVISFCASQIRQILNVKNYFVFPIYHGAPGERKGARFKPGRENIIELPFDKDDRKMKEAVLGAHASQKGHFDGMQNNDSDYRDLLLSREVFYEVAEPMNFLGKPMAEVGYEKHRNGFKFSDFRKAIEGYYSK